jgi:phenylacetate-coenzyme A ligase PaaK-like adenylate-forming protein
MTITVSRRASRTDALRAVVLSRRLAARDRWSPEAAARHRARRLHAATTWAVRRSAIYRERLGADGRTAPVTKAELMARWTEWVADPSLADLDALRAHLATQHDDELIDGRFRAMSTSGSSRIPGVFVFDRGEWTTVCALGLRCLQLGGLRPSIPRPRAAWVVSPPGPHMAARVASTVDTLPVFRRRLSHAVKPLPEIVADLQALQPHMLVTYGSMAGILAAEQLAGRLRIGPRAVMSTSDPLTAESAELIRRAWSVSASDLYAMTETGPVGVTCERGRMHLFEDEAVVEVVDDDLRPVPDGEQGSRVLVTNLFARTQPIVRLEVGDVLRIDPQPCPCGRPWRVVAEIGGRTDDVLLFAGADGRGEVRVHPIAFGVLGAVEGVGEFEVVLHDERLTLRVAAGSDEAAQAAGEAVRGRLGELGAAVPQIVVERVDDLREQRAALRGKLKLVRDERSPQSGTT